MNQTQNDLSYDHVKLDYKAMLKTSAIAYGSCLEEISRHWQELKRVPIISSSSQVLHAQWLKDVAEKLVISVETYTALQEGLTRSQLEIVNKPEVIE